MIRKALILALAALLLAGCTGKSGEVALTFAEPVAVGNSKANPQDPFLQIGSDQSVWLSWTELESDGKGRTAYLSPVDRRSLQVTMAHPVNDKPGTLSTHGGENLAKFTVGKDGAVTSIWMVPGQAQRTGDLHIGHAADGMQFAPAVTLNDDGKPVNHAFATVAAAPDGKVYAAWIDGRERTDPKDDRQTLYMAVSADGGRTFGKNYRIGQAVCACCRTAIAFLDGGKTVLVSYRHVTKPDNVRNHVVVRSTDGGKTFSEPVIVSEDGWVSPSCPHAGLALMADARGRLHASWWTGGRAAAEAGIYYTSSDDGGLTWKPRERIAEAPADTVLHTQIAADSRGTVHVAWEGVVGEGTQIFCASRRADATAWSSPAQVTRVAGSASFPVLAATDEKLYLAWTERQGEESKVKLTAATLKGNGPGKPLKLGVVKAGAPRPGGEAPDFTLKGMNGSLVTLSALRGKPLVLNFFATWCEPCREEMPLVADAYLKSESGGYQVLGVAVRDNRNAVGTFFAETNAAIPVVFDGDNAVTRAYRVVGPPATFFLGSDGKVVSVIYGPLNRESLDRELAKVTR